MAGTTRFSPFWLMSELGVGSAWTSSRDTKFLFLQRFIRLFAYGASTLVLALYLSSLNVSDARIGLFMTLTLLGDVIISFFLTLFADGLGRRRVMVAGALLMSLSGFVFALSSNFWILVLASIVGVISPSGNEIGPFRAIEESTLAQLTPSSVRSDIFAWYTLLGSAGTACGTIVCGWIVEELKTTYGWTDIKSYRAIFFLYALLGITKTVLSLMLSEKCEPEPEPEQRGREDAFELDDVEAEGLLSDDEDERVESDPKPASLAAEQRKKRFLLPNISASSRKTLVKLCMLFAVDSFASGLIPLSWIIFFFSQKFSMPEGQLGTLFFITNIISSISTLVASSISKRIGLIKTMVFTHLPSAIFLALIPLPSNVVLSIIFLAIRSSMQSMDQAPRQAFIAAAVLPNERTAVMGVVNVVKTLSQSGAPSVTGWLAQIGNFWIAFVIAGSLKVSYDLALLKMFLGYKTYEPVEENTPRPQDEEAMSRNGVR